MLRGMDAPRTISSRGLALLKGYEKLSLSFYADEAGIISIYWGHVVRPGEQFDHTTEEAERVLAQDLRTPEQCVAAWCSKAQLTENQFDALVCFAFNEGVQALHSSTLLRLVQARDFAAAADEFPKWDKVHVKGRITESEGLRKRRAAERNLFLDLPWSGP